MPHEPTAEELDAGRRVEIGAWIDTRVAAITTMSLQHLDVAGTGQLIGLIVDSPGADPVQATAVADEIGRTRSPVATHAAGTVAGAAVLVVAAGHEKRRSATVDCRWQLAWLDVDRTGDMPAGTPVEAFEPMSRRFAEQLARRSRRPPADWLVDLRRERAFTSAEAVAWGLIDRVGGDVGGVPVEPSPAAVAERPAMTFRDVLLKLCQRGDLTRSEAEFAFTQVMLGQADEAQVGGLLVGLAAKGSTVEELVGAATVMRRQAVAIATPPGAVVLDTCGTGGDVKGTFNISTVAAIIAAAAGVTVVKHGNRSASGRTGSADVLEQLGVNLDGPTDRCLADANICFAFARSHHPAMRHVAAARSSLGIPTLFNLLGPLTNPGGARHQLLGVFAAELTERMAAVLGQLGSERAWVVHADDGLDEISTMGPTRVSELRGGVVRTWRLDPVELGLRRASLADLQVGTTLAAADAVRSVLGGDAGPRRDVAVLNAAAALVVAGRAGSLAEGLTLAAAAVDSGAAARTLARLAAASAG